MKNRKKKLPSVTKAAAPYMLTPDDPAYRKPYTRKTKSYSGKSTKYLTKVKPPGIIELVKKLKRKDDKMAHDKNKKSNKSNAVISIAWLVEATFRGFVGWILLNNFDHLVTTAAGIYALGTAGVIVVMHFVRAHK